MAILRPNRADMEALINAGNIVVFNGVRYFTIESLPTQEEIDQFYTSNQGPAGEQGPIGPQGPQGEPGPQGEQGPQGPMGLGINFTGAYDAGTAYAADDAVSYQGETWVALQASLGVTPVEGANWTKAIAKGEQGAQGSVGSQGPIGPQGSEGPQGEIGPQGPKGDTGDTGPIGLTGSTGPKGDKGDKGDTGNTGPAGAPGTPSIGTILVQANTSAVLTGSQTTYGGFGLNPAATSVFDVTEANVRMVMPVACTLKNLTTLAKSTAGAGIVVTVRKNGVDTALTATASPTSGTVVADNVNSVAFAAGDILTLKFVNLGAGSSNIITYSLNIV